MGMRGVESALENIVTSVFSRSRSTIRPVELGRRLLREIDDHRTVDVKGRRVVPNDFVFHLSPRDHAGFASFEDELKHELREAASSYAHDEGYHLVGPVRVELIVDESLKPGRFGIASQVVKQAQPAPAEAPAAAQPPQPATPSAQPEPAPPAPLAPPVAAIDNAALDDAAIWASASPAPSIIPPPPPPPPPMVPVPHLPEMAAPLPPIVPLEPVRVYDAEADITVDPRPAAALIPAPAPTPRAAIVNTGQRPATIGRLPECDITVADVNVSRRHAEIRPGTPFTIVDLGSTNGTKVNGARIDGPHMLHNGDVITLGGTQLRFEASSPSA
jgi:hypothetical protein